MDTAAMAIWRSQRIDSQTWTLLLIRLRQEKYAGAYKTKTRPDRAMADKSLLFEAELFTCVTK
jgi:hypothetical protein